jgi:hypothetical protein
MPKSSLSGLRVRLLLLFVLGCGLAAAGPAGSGAVVDQLSDIQACAGTFDGGLSGCISTYTQCGSNPSCGPEFGSCFGDQVHTYSECLGNVEFRMDFCSNARAAADRCQASYEYCVDTAQTQEQLGDCMMTVMECRNASGIDSCQ